MDKHNFLHENVSAKNDQKIYDSIRDFGIRIIKKRNEKKSEIISSTPSGATSNNNQASKSNSTSNTTNKPTTPNTAVHIGNQK